MNLKKLTKKQKIALGIGAAALIYINYIDTDLIVGKPEEGGNYYMLHLSNRLKFERPFTGWLQNHREFNSENL